MTAQATVAAGKPYHGIPGPRGRWLIGDALEYDKDPIGWMTSTQSRYGDIVRLDPSTVMLHDPDAVHELLAMTNGPVILDNALLSERASLRDLLARLPEWMTVRRDTLRSLHRSLIAEHLGRIAGALRGNLARNAGQDLDVFAVAQRLCGQATADFCLGADGPADDVADGVERLFWVSLELSERAEARRRWTRRPTMHRAMKVNDDLLGMLAGRVARRRAAPRPGQARDLLDVLLAGATAHEANGANGTNGANGANEATDRHLAAVLRITMVASHGIPGAALAWTLLRLHNSPEAVSAIRAEVRSLPFDPLRPGERATGTGPPWLPTDDMPYTSAVVKEVLRLYPPAWLMFRKVIEPVTIAGFAIPPGTKIGICPYLIHRDERWWAEPGTFSPGRWLTPGQPSQRYAYLPFGSGPRYCVGGHLGMVQLVLLAAELAAHYRLNLPDPGTVPVTCRSLLLPGDLRGRWVLRDDGAGPAAGSVRA